MQTSEEHDPQPLTWHEAFLAESKRLDPSFAVPDDTDDTGDIGARSDPSTRLSRLNRAAFDAGHTALCLSGGGIRSASFAVGVLQALAQRGLIRGFDYLSTVSGGGFAGAWLSTWLHRAGAGPAGAPPGSATGDDPDDRDQAHAALRLFEGAPGSPGSATVVPAVEPWPVTRLRSSTRYLSPATGFFSADSWGLVATLLRNTLLNWAVLLPLLAAAMLVPRFQFALLHLLEQEPDSARSLWEAFDFQALAVATVAFTVAIVHIIANLPSFGNRGQSERQFLAWGLLPLAVGTLALTFYWATWAALDIDLAQFTAGGALVSLVVCAGTGLIAGSRPFRPRTWLAAAVSGAVGALVYWQLLETLFNYDDLSRAYVTFAFPLVMVTLLLQAVVFVGLAGREMVAADLEWWSRAAAWLLIVTAGWLIVCGVAFGVPLLFGRLLGWLPHAIHAVGGAAAVAGGLMSWLLRPSGEGTAPSWQRRLMLALAAPVSVVLIVGGVAALDDRMVRALTTVGDDRTFLALFQRWPICQPAQEAEYSRYRCHPADGGFGETVVLFVALLAIGYLTSRLVPVNKFSLHDMYHHRLTRAYLGASRHGRAPNAFTGFDPEDDVELAALADQRPFHVINTTLNARMDPRLGQRETRAFPFSLSPLHAGSNVLGAYRPSADYAYNPLRRRGITLGTAVTVSGAAASPQMGEYTSPALAFLLTVFNARLGVWLGNPGPAGRSTWRRRDPKAAFGPILREMLGWTTEANPYVFLSDGGHFDNLGLWEMALRRVRHIVIVDSGCDPEYRFEDLATAVRRARVDHGAEIVFDAEAMNALRDEPLKPHVVTGTIRYIEAPGEAGSVFYIKPGLSNDEPVDVVTYRKAHPAFPHESTANQWFTEAQFESYRALGFHSVQAALADTSEAGLGRLAESLRTRAAEAAPALT